MPSPSEVRWALLGLTTLAQRELTQAWAHANGRAAEDVRDFLMEVVPAVADKYGLAAGTLAADWYDEIREEAGPAGRFLAEPASPPDSSRYEALVRWGVDPLFRPVPDAPAARSLILGGLSKIVTNLHGETLTVNSYRDPASQGWSRHTRGGSCDVCRALAGRGAVYRAATADFATHDHCSCVAVPEFGAVSEVRDYERTKRFASEAARKKNNATLRDFAESN